MRVREVRRQPREELAPLLVVEVADREREEVLGELVLDVDDHARDERARHVEHEEVEARDRADEEREIAPLRAAADAIIVATEGKAVHQVFDEVMARLPKH